MEFPERIAGVSGRAARLMESANGNDELPAWQCHDAQEGG
jgi:hypothetical protein